MKAMLFSAGLGTRLYPLTKDKPKALAPFAGTTLLGYNLKFLSSQGINSFIINTHHFAGKIENYLKKNDFFGLDITISYEEELLDTAGGVAKIRDKINEDQLLLYNVDVVSNIDIEKMYNYHCDNRTDITLAIRNRSTSRFLLFDDNNVMTGWKNENTGELKRCNEKEEYNKFAFSGITILNTDILNEIGIIEKKSLINFYLDICKNRKILAFNHDDNFWFDCGSMEKLKRAEDFIINKYIKFNNSTNC